MMPILRRAKDAYESSTTLRHELEAVRLIMLEGSAWKAHKAAVAIGAPAGVQTTLKTAAAAITSSSAADVMNVNAVFPALQASLRTATVVDAVGAEAMSANFFTRIGMFTTNITGAKVAEGAAGPTQFVSIAANTITPEKFEATVVATMEFLRDAPGALESLLAQLQLAAGTAADTEFLADIAANNSDVSSGLGTTSLTDILSDIVLQLLASVNYAQRSSLVLVVGKAHARAMTIAAMGAGINTMGVLGGFFGGIRTIVSDALPADTISLIDASGIAVAMSPIMVRTSSETTLQLDTAPAGTSGPSVSAQNMVSMFQSNSAALRVERSIAWAPLRPNAYASLTSIGWGITADSPLPG
jgi:hypothetical protein